MLERAIANSRNAFRVRPPSADASNALRTGAAAYRHIITYSTWQLHHAAHVVSRRGGPSASVSQFRCLSRYCGQ